MAEWLLSTSMTAIERLKKPLKVKKVLTNVVLSDIIHKNLNKGFDEDGFELGLLESRRLVQADSKNL